MQKFRLRLQQDTLINRAVRTCMGLKLPTRLTEELATYFITAKDLARPGFYDYKVNTRFRNPHNDLIAICDASLRIQAYRDRVCEIQLEIVNIRGILQRSYKAAEEVIYEIYGAEMQSYGMRSEAAQKHFISKVLQPVTDRLLVSGNQLVQIEAILNNLDKAHFAYKAVGELAEKILSRSEGGNTVARQYSREA